MAGFSTNGIIFIGKMNSHKVWLATLMKVAKPNTTIKDLTKILLDYKQQTW